MKDIEEKFKQAYDEAYPLIIAKLIEAENLIREAEAISEQYGVSFDADVSRLSQSYHPKSLRKWFEGENQTDKEIYNQFQKFNLYLHDGFTDGWEHSQVCY